MSNPRSPRDYIAHADRIVMLGADVVHDERGKAYEAWLVMHKVSIELVRADGVMIEMTFTFEGHVSVTLVFGQMDHVARTGGYALAIVFYAVHHGFTTWETV